MKKVILWLLLTAMALSLLSGCTSTVRRSGKLTPPSTMVEGIGFSTKEVMRGDVSAKTAGYGAFAAAHPVHVYFTYTGGLVDTINFTYFNKVNEGDVLMQLNTEELEFNMQKLDIRYAKQAAAYEKNGKSLNARTRTEAEWAWQEFLLEYNKAKATLESATLKAPVSGTIIQNTSLQPNDYAGTYSTMFTIADTKDLVLVITKDSELEKLANIAFAGMDVDVTITGKSYKGTILQSPVDASPRTEKNYTNKYIYVKVYDLPENEELIFKEGRLSITTASVHDSLIIPNNCIYSYNGRSYVYVIREGIQVEQPIEIGITDGTNTEVISGLTEGEQIVTQMGR